jgi:cell division protein FtsL
MESMGILILLVAGYCIYLTIRIGQLQNHVIDLYKKINGLATRVKELETSIANLSVKDSFSIKEDGTIVREK